MSGVAVIGYLLRNTGAMTAIVPSARVYSGVLPLNTVLPALSVAQVSGQEWLPVRSSGVSLMTERVQVSVMTKSYATQKAAMKAIRDAVTYQRGTIGGFAVDSILPDTVSPDIQDPDSGNYFQSQDFIVKWRE